MLDPTFTARFVWILGRRGLAQLWRAPGPNARFFILSSLLWTIPLSLSNTYKSLYLSGLGLSNLAIGGFNALDTGARVLGVLVGAGLATRSGHKNVLNLADFVSWIIPTGIMAIATEPWQIYLASIFSATNSLVFASVQQFMLEDTPESRRSNTFALMNLIGSVPGLLLPALLGGVIDQLELVPAMRVILLFQMLCMGAGIVWRWRVLSESTATRPKISMRDLLRTFQSSAIHMLSQRSFGWILGSYVLVNVSANLWQAYFGLYVVQSLHQPNSMVGYSSAVRAGFFVAGSILLVPLMSRMRLDRGYLWSSALNWIGPLLLLFHPGAWGLMTLSGLAGLFWAAQAALMMSGMSRFLPKGSEGLSFVICVAVMLGVSSLSFSLTGALFDSHFGTFPWICLGLGVIQTLMVFRAERSA